MNKPAIAQQHEFKTIDDFIDQLSPEGELFGQNNFYAHFYDNEWGRYYRSTPHFKRFQDQYPELEAELTRKVTKTRTSAPRGRLPYEQLYEAYKLMSGLVYCDDPHVMQDGKPDEDFLTR